MLVFSYVGDNPVEKTVKGSVINVNLSSDVQNINEVVVTAIGIKQEKKKLGYTTQQVDGTEIAAAGNLNAGASLQGEVAGLTVSIPSGMFQSPDTPPSRRRNMNSAAVPKVSMLFGMEKAGVSPMMTCSGDHAWT